VDQQSQIIVTKLYRPPLPADFVCRNRLEQKLEAGFWLPLTLVSSPAGYGKSSLISHWLQNRHPGSCWLSLDDTHNSLRSFLAYFVAAVQTVSAGVFRDIQSLLASENLPSPETLAGLICNDLDISDRRFILVLDDYYRISNPEIHQFLEQFLRHPPRSLHLAIVTRFDPPISLSRMRGKGLVTEIRMQNLQFDEAETAEFLRRALDRPVSPQAVKHLVKKTEGWPVATRLAALTLKNCTDADQLISSFGRDSRELQDYLITEILAQQPEGSRDCLVRTSILERFSAPLCEELCGKHCSDQLCVFRKRQSAQPVRDIGLLCIPLDDRGEWFRYHHLFQDLLRRRLESSLDPDGISQLHKRSALWFEERGLLEDALRHLLAAGDLEGAGQLIARNRDTILNEEWWFPLEQWLKWLPPKVVENDADLLVLKAQLFQTRCRYADSRKLFSSIETLLDREPEEERKERYRANLAALRCLERYVEGDNQQALKSAREALSMLPGDCHLERGQSILILSMSLQIAGHLDQAREILYRELEPGPDQRSITYRSRLFGGLSFTDWIEADFTSLRRSGRGLMEVGDHFGLGDSSAAGRYFIGIAEYQLNRISEAQSILLPVVSNQFVANLEFYAQSVFALASVYQAQGQAAKANEVVETLADKMLNFGNVTVLSLAKAFQADLAWRQGNRGNALQWARGFSPPPLTPMYRFHSPHVTLAKVLALSEDNESRKGGEQLLDQLEQYLSETHNRRFLAEVLVVRALAYQNRDEWDKALSALDHAVSIAEPGRMVRVLADLGPEVVPLLQALNADREPSPFIEELISIFEVTETSPKAQGRSVASSYRNGEYLVESLSNRELEILELICKRLTNKEIADHLCISAGTVKRHAENIYGKLGVSGRRDAAALAQELGLLGS